MPVTKKQIAETADAFLEGLDLSGIPGTKAAKKAVESVEKLRQSSNAKENLVGLLAQVGAAKRV